MLLWGIWLAVVAASWAGFECFAIVTGRPTLSRFVWTVSKRWPPFPWVVGLLTGFLASHFFWGGALICYAPVQ